jgi:hypothetical protein
MPRCLIRSCRPSDIGIRAREFLSIPETSHSDASVEASIESAEHESGMAIRKSPPADAAAGRAALRFSGWPIE